MQYSALFELRKRRLHGCDGAIAPKTKKVVGAMPPWNFVVIFFEIYSKKIRVCRYASENVTQISARAPKAIGPAGELTALPQGPKPLAGFLGVE